MTHAYAFDAQLQMSCGYAASASVERILLENVPGAVAVIRANGAQDRDGVDFWVQRKGARSLAVDVKVRELDWRAKGKDDLALEVWSVKEKQVLGWTLNSTKQTDYVLWLWKDTGRWCLVPFAMLCAVFQRKRDEWVGQYQSAVQFTPDKGYHSECVFVPRLTVWRAIYNQFGGAA